MWAVSLILISFASYIVGGQNANKATEHRSHIHAAENKYSAADSLHFLRIEQQLLQMDSIIYRQSIRELSFDSVLRTQTSIFASIVTAALIFVGLFSYQVFFALVSDSRKTFHDRVIELQEKFDSRIAEIEESSKARNKQIEDDVNGIIHTVMGKFEDFQKTIDPIKVDLFDTQGKTFRQLFELEEAANNHECMFNYALRAAYAFFTAQEFTTYETQQQNYYGATILNLNDVKRSLIKSDAHALQLQISHANIDIHQALRIMIGGNDSQISNLCIEILADLNNKLDELDDASPEMALD
jgi:hypothetical protein